jgi:hypothetical protein
VILTLAARKLIQNINIDPLPKGGGDTVDLNKGQNMILEMKVE